MEHFNTIRELESFVNNDDDLHYSLYYLSSDIRSIKKRSFLSTLLNKNAPHEIYNGYSLHPCLVMNINHDKETIDIIYWTPEDVERGRYSKDTVKIDELFK